MVLFNRVYSIYLFTLKINSATTSNVAPRTVHVRAALDHELWHWYDNWQPSVAAAAVDITVAIQSVVAQHGRPLSSVPTLTKIDHSCKLGQAEQSDACLTAWHTQQVCRQAKPALWLSYLTNEPPRQPQLLHQLCINYWSVICFVWQEDIGVHSAVTHIHAMQQLLTLDWFLCESVLYQYNKRSMTWLPVVLEY